MQPEGRPFIRFHRLPTVGLAHTVYSLFGNLLSRLGLAVSGLVLYSGDFLSFHSLCIKKKKSRII